MKTNKVHKYWENQNNPSMEDKFLLNLEINLIKKQLGPGKILDVGCGEGEGTYAYSKIKGVIIEGIDYSETRLKMARKNFPGINFKKIDLLQKYKLNKYDYIISQRCLINLINWTQQKKVIKDLIALLKPNGKLILLEGSKQGVIELNKFRAKLNLKPISIRWHNKFIDDNNLINAKFVLTGNLGGYFLLTRGISPFFKPNPNWNCTFNKLATKIEMDSKFSRLKLWIYQK
ncbi:hypothetical protein COX09_03660 [Candidatus Beckwithbacteria bacterium CG23_combo_of_CG06-09_8_20_14_all_47_9]|uniref:Methyltransferase domain-containing protein n=1 Tax=Candidatus Beckwithbacteria bacterium CG23_combo_of_CG06-09_8_20_14_all_47_9 TaxID=1974498 RepID=A0A2H0B334_9BACT|nr:MAG: hypothetical protein COX09_03660 [Candidatus Beckwithbacteria bacterium CG23_combo_of_CG06-09_8_20_14_all_47_9]